MVGDRKVGLRATRGDIVRVRYSGRLTNGTEIGSSEGTDHVEFEIGAGQVPAGLERGILGMRVGDSKTIEIACVDAYGPRRPDFVLEVGGPRSRTALICHSAWSYALTATMAKSSRFASWAWRQRP